MWRVLCFEEILNLIETVDLGESDAGGKIENLETLVELSDRLSPTEYARLKLRLRQVKLAVSVLARYSACPELDARNNINA